MFKLAHISDPHLGPLPDLRAIQLASKRVLGYVNWQRNRARSLTSDYLATLLQDLADQNADHIALTGDLVNIALPQEIEAAGAWLQRLGDPDRVSVVPGNHDAYVPGALKMAKKAWAPYMLGDGRAEPVVFPYCRKRNGIALVGTSSARATAPFMATGHFGRDQADRLGKLLHDLAGDDLFRVVMIHHPPFRHATHWHKRLVQARRVRAVIAEKGAELVLHGHTHVDSLEWIEGPDGPVPVVGVPSASNAPGGRHPGARYNIFEIEPQPGGWSCRMHERGFTGTGAGVSDIRIRDLLAKKPGNPVQKNSALPAAH